MPTNDFFISYRWDTYSPEAKALKDIAASRGFTAWLDVEHPFQAPSQGSDEALAKHLKEAMESCRYVLFFETAAKIAKQVGGPSIRMRSWQEQELTAAEEEKLIILYHTEPRTMSFGMSSKLHNYQDLPEAFELVEKAVGDPDGPLWRR